MDSVTVQFDQWRHECLLISGPIIICPESSKVPLISWSHVKKEDNPSTDINTTGSSQATQQFVEGQGNAVCEADTNSSSSSDLSLLAKLKSDLPAILQHMPSCENTQPPVHCFESSTELNTQQNEGHLPSFETDSLERASVAPQLSSNCSPDDIFNLRVESLSDDVFETESDTNRRLGTYERKLNTQNETGEGLMCRGPGSSNDKTDKSVSPSIPYSEDLTSNDSVELSLSSGSFTIDLDLCALQTYESEVERREEFIISEGSDHFELSNTRFKSQDELSLSETHSFDTNYGNVEHETITSGNYEEAKQSCNTIPINNSKVHEPMEARPGHEGFIAKEKERTDIVSSVDAKENLSNIEVDVETSSPVSKDNQVNCISNKQRQFNCDDTDVSKPSRQMFKNINSEQKSSSVFKSEETIGTNFDRGRTEDCANAEQGNSITSNTNRNSDVSNPAALATILQNHDSIDHAGFCKFTSSSSVDRNNLLSTTNQTLEDHAEPYQDQDPEGIVDQYIEEFVNDIIGGAANLIMAEYEEAKSAYPLSVYHVSDSPLRQSDSEESTFNSDIVIDYRLCQGYSDETYLGGLAPIPEVDPILENYTVQSVYNDISPTGRLWTRSEETLPSIPEYEQPDVETDMSESCSNSVSDSDLTNCFTKTTQDSKGIIDDNKDSIYFENEIAEQNCKEKRDKKDSRVSEVSFDILSNYESCNEDTGRIEGEIEIVPLCTPDHRRENDTTPQDRNDNVQDISTFIPGGTRVELKEITSFIREEKSDDGRGLLTCIDEDDKANETPHFIATNKNDNLEEKYPYISRRNEDKLNKIKEIKEESPCIFGDESNKEKEVSPYISEAGDVKSITQVDLSPTNCYQVKMDTNEENYEGINETDPCKYAEKYNNETKEIHLCKVEDGDKNQPRKEDIPCKVGHEDETDNTKEETSKNKLFQYDENNISIMSPNRDHDNGDTDKDSVIVFSEVNETEWNVTSEKEEPKCVPVDICQNIDAYFVESLVTNSITNNVQKDGDVTKMDENGPDKFSPKLSVEIANLHEKEKDIISDSIIQSSCAPNDVNDKDLDNDICVKVGEDISVDNQSKDHGHMQHLLDENNKVNITSIPAEKGSEKSEVETVVQNRSKQLYPNQSIEIFAEENVQHIPPANILNFENDNLIKESKSIGVFDVTCQGKKQSEHNTIEDYSKRDYQQHLDIVLENENSDTDKLETDVNVDLKKDENITNTMNKMTDAENDKIDENIRNTLNNMTEAENEKTINSGEHNILEDSTTTDNENGYAAENLTELRVKQSGLEITNEDAINHTVLKNSVDVKHGVDNVVTEERVVGLNFEQSEEPENKTPSLDNSINVAVESSDISKRKQDPTSIQSEDAHVNLSEQWQSEKNASKEGIYSNCSLDSKNNPHSYRLFDRRDPIPNQKNPKRHTEQNYNNSHEIHPGSSERNTEIENNAKQSETKEKTFVKTSLDKPEASMKAKSLSKILKSNLSSDLTRRPEYRHHSRYQSLSFNEDDKQKIQEIVPRHQKLSLRKAKSFDLEYSHANMRTVKDSANRNVFIDTSTPEYYSDSRRRRMSSGGSLDEEREEKRAMHQRSVRLERAIANEAFENIYGQSGRCHKLRDLDDKPRSAPGSFNRGDKIFANKTFENQDYIGQHSDINAPQYLQCTSRQYPSGYTMAKESSLSDSRDKRFMLDQKPVPPSKHDLLGYEQPFTVCVQTDFKAATIGDKAAAGDITKDAISNVIKPDKSIEYANTPNELAKRRTAFRDGTFKVKRLSSEDSVTRDINPMTLSISQCKDDTDPDIKDYIEAINLENRYYNNSFDKYPNIQKTSKLAEPDECESKPRRTLQFMNENHGILYEQSSCDNAYYTTGEKMQRGREELVKIQNLDKSSTDISTNRTQKKSSETSKTVKRRPDKKSHSQLHKDRPHHRAPSEKSQFYESIGMFSKQVITDQSSKESAAATHDISLIDTGISQCFNQNNGRARNNVNLLTDTDKKRIKNIQQIPGYRYRDNRSGQPSRGNKDRDTEMRIQENLEKKQKDGPLSLTDAYGSMEPNDNQSGHALSNSANHLSESMTSLSNRHAPVASPSRQSTLQKQHSLQSTHSELNGDHRQEEGIKFERLKNLPEEDLMVKIKEIIGHMERLEDYHRGDGMRIQKMLGDMYWDYTHMREMIGDCMADSGYAVVSMTMLKTLNSIGIFKNDDVWFPTYYTYNTMWNFTDSSSKLAKALSENDAVRLLTLNCGHKPYINAIHSKNVYYVIKASLSILHNIARNSGMKHLFDENKTSETIMPFLESEDEMLKILATLTIANIVDEEENKTIIAESGTIHDIVNWIEKALSLPRRRYKGFTPQELTEGLNKLAVNDANKMRIVDEGALQMFLQMLQHDDIREQSAAARIVWTLSFDKDVRQKINDNTELVSVLEKLTDSTNKILQTNCSGALWIIRGDNDVTTEKRPKTNRSKSHVFLSYASADKEIVLNIRDRLRAEGYAIWIDIEKMGKATLETMTEAIENSAVVLVCMSEKYKQSPNCRTESEYTFQLKKDYIPLMMQKKYRPDGWVGTILGAKLYFDFSGKYPFDKSFQGLLKELRGRGKVTPNTTPGDSNDHTDPAMVHSMSLSSHTSAGTPVHHMSSNSAILNMGQEELIKWLRNIKLTECIPAFMEFDGRLLMQLKVMRTEAPEFFYQCLEKRLNMSLIEILKFTRALEDL